jgi:hypothetical protein
MVDSNLDIFVSQFLFSNTADIRSMKYPNWNLGVLPPEASGSSFAFGMTSGQVVWGVGASDNSFCSVRDTVINSRTHPTLVALPMTSGESSTANGIRVLNAADGSVVSVTNGSTVQSLTNIDSSSQYTCAAWDNVGNLYGASTTRNLWRVWSPPGANQATTVAAAKVILSPPFVITGITATPAGGGCSSVAISFTASGNPAPSAFTLLASSTVNGNYAPATASITGGSGSYLATATSCSTAFYRIEEAP